MYDPMFVFLSVLTVLVLGLAFFFGLFFILTAIDAMSADTDEYLEEEEKGKTRNANTKYSSNNFKSRDR